METAVESGTATSDDGTPPYDDDDDVDISSILRNITHMPWTTTICED